MAGELSQEELERKIVHYLETRTLAKNKDIAKALGVEKSLVDKAVNKLTAEGTLEFVYLGASFVKKAGKQIGEEEQK